MNHLPTLVLLQSLSHLGGAASSAVPLGPTGACEVVDATYTVRWTDYDEAATVPAIFRWAYTRERPPPYWPGVPPVGLTGTTIAEDIDERDLANEIVWDTSQVPAGAYFLWSFSDDPPFEVITFARGVVVVAHEGDPVWPTVLPTRPGVATEVADAAIDLTFEACDPDGSGTVTLEATKNYDGTGLEVIASGLPASAGTFSWDTSELCPGIRYVRATIEDGRGLSFRNWAPWGVSIQHEASFDLEAHGCVPALPGDGGGGGGGGAGGSPAVKDPAGERPAPRKGGCGTASLASLLLLLPRRRQGG